MFYDNFIKFCNQFEKAPSAVAAEIGLNRASVTGWKNGSIPSDSTLQKLADYFSVEVEELTGHLKPADSRYACEKIAELMKSNENPFGYIIPAQVKNEISAGTYKMDLDTLKILADSVGLPVDHFRKPGIKKFSIVSEKEFEDQKEKPAPISEDEQKINAELSELLRRLTPLEADKVRCFVQGIISGR